MSSQATRAAKEFHGSELAGVSIGERQILPGVRDASPQNLPVLLCDTASFQFFSIILGTDSLHLPFA